VADLSEIQTGVARIRNALQAQQVAQRKYR
jgi:hypothetical protein